MPHASPGPGFGFKIVTLRNVLEVDPVVADHVTLNHATGAVRAQAPEDWVPLVMGITLDSAVPHEVRKMFTFAQGAMCYAHWYYPLLTLISHDLLRVADFATVEACRERGLVSKTMHKRIAALVAHGAIAPRDERLWSSIRDARNRTTHPPTQSIYGFGLAFDILRTIRDLIESVAWLAT